MRLLLLAAVLAVLLVGTSPVSAGTDALCAAPVREDTVRVDGHDLTVARFASFELGPLERPYANWKTAPRPEGWSNAAMPWFRYEERNYFQPVSTAQKGIMVLAREDVRNATRFADALISHSVRRKGGMWFPYRFPIHVLNTDFEPDWYSALAQGNALSLFSRLYEATGREKYRTAAAAVFQTLRPGSEAVMVRDGYLWFLEYPVPNPVFNGHISVVWGLYDYHRITGNRVAETLARAGMTTVREYVDRFDGNGWLFYDFDRTTNIPPGENNYRVFYVHSMVRIGDLTGDGCFHDAALAFAKGLG